MGAFFLNQSLNKSLCSITTAVFRNWSEMKRLSDISSRPFLFLIRETSIKPLRKKNLGNPADEQRKRERHPKGEKAKDVTP
jgi:hypothetical protein